jgi:pyruvate dehydrogenase E1 component alpha subunit
MFDSELYREKSEVELWKLRDPIEKLRADLTSEGLLDGRAWLALEAAVEAEIAQAVAFAETAELEPVEELTRFVVSDRSASRTPAARAESSRKGESAGTR